MNFKDYVLASALPEKKDFEIIHRNKTFNLNYLNNPKPLKNLSQGFFNRLQKLNLDELKKFYENAKNKYNLLRIDDKKYPKILKKIIDPPVYLFVWGNYKILGQPALAFVGSRRATAYGKKVTYNLIFNLNFPWVIVSGLAMGVDGFSHRAALEAGKQTVGVLGSGFFNLYPYINQKLAMEIVENQGAIVSEYPPHFEPTQYFFPARNRIIAGLSQAVIVVEAAKKSGSLITASQAAKNGRDVLCVPNEIFSLTSEGCFFLMRQGVKSIFAASDIEEDYFSLFPKVKNAKKKDPMLRYLITPKHLDEIAKKFKKSSSEILSQLAQMELDGKIKSLGSGFYQAI
ncbi:MAG: DNA-processing protein DprA [Patescibacteria group bacterium]|nr:DNA-processing protein DprA [Patescibacteria group bacterium]